MKRKQHIPSSVDLSFRHRAASIRWVADRMGESKRAELRTYADQLDAKADRTEHAMNQAAPTLEPTEHE